MLRLSEKLQIEYFIIANFPVFEKRKTPPASDAGGETLHEQE